MNPTGQACTPAFTWVEALGRGTICFAVVACAPIAAHLTPQSAVAPDQPVTLAVDTGHLHVVAPETGKALTGRPSRSGP